MYIKFLKIIGKFKYRYRLVIFGDLRAIIDKLVIVWDKKMPRSVDQKENWIGGR